MLTIACFAPFFQVDLHFLKVLTGIATQGAVSKETQKSYYVTTFKLEVSTNGEDWMVYRHGKNHKVGTDTELTGPCKRGGQTPFAYRKINQLYMAHKLKVTLLNQDLNL